MDADRMFKLETKEEILRMKAINRFIQAHGMTLEMVIEEYLREDEKEQLIKLDNSIITESIKPFIEADLIKKQRAERKVTKKKKKRKK